MAIPLWLGFALFFAAVITSSVGAPVAILIAVGRANKKRRLSKYPQTIPGYGARMARCPFTATDVADLISDVEIAWSNKFGHNRPAVRAKLDNLDLEWLRPIDQSSRSIVDDYGRRIAGDQRGSTIRVVYLDSDEVGHTALTHELAHRLLELTGDNDGKHVNTKVWDLVASIRESYQSAR